MQAGVVNMDKRFWRMAQYAYETVPLYIKRGRHYSELEKWEDIPVLKKAEILNHPDSFYSSEFFSISKDNIIKRHTSGTTGKCLELYWDIDDYKKSLMPIWIYRRKFYGINPGDKMCYFFTTSNMGIEDNTECEEEEMKNVKGFSKNNLSRERMLEIYSKIVQYNPVWMFIQPSMAMILCDAAEEDGRRISGLKYIEFTGEMLTKEVRSRTEKVFGCNTANHYGCNEVNTIAFECPAHNMHVIGRDIYVETVNIEGDGATEAKQEGELLVTSALNRVNPFIRYAVGDRAKIYEDIKCTCGCNGRVIELTSARTHDFIVTEDGSKINSYIFVHAVEAVNREFDGCIMQFQVVQEDYQRFLVKLAIDEEVYYIGVTQQMIEEKFLSNILQPEIQNADYEFEVYHHLFPDENSGKLSWFINR